MKQIKRILSLACAAALTFSLAACGNKETTDYSGQILYGQVTDISENTVTVKLGEWTEAQVQPPEKSEGDSDGSQAPPEMPEGDSGSGQAPLEMPEGDSGSGQSPPEKPEGDNGSAQTPPEKTDKGGNSNTTAMPDAMPEMKSSFTVGDDTASFNFSKVTITIKNGQESSEGSVSDIQIDDILEITVGDNNTVSAVTVKSLNSAPGNENFGRCENISDYRSCHMKQIGVI